MQNDKESVIQAIRKHPEISLMVPTETTAHGTYSIRSLLGMHALTKKEKKMALNRGCSCKADHASANLTCLQPIRPACDESPCVQT